MNRELYFGYIESKLIFLKELISIENSFNLNSKNIYLEDFLGTILSTLYDCNLSNTNLIETNYPSMDLADKSKKIAFQITTQTKRDKVENSLSSFFDYGYNKVYSTFIIVIFDNHNFNGEFTVPKGFSFTKKDNIIDFKKLLSLLFHADEAKLKIIYDYFIYVFEKKIYDTSWSLRLTNMSFDNLGPRYNRNLNVYTDEENKLEFFFLKNKTKDEIMKLLYEIRILIENTDTLTFFDFSSLELDFSKERFISLYDDLNNYFKKILDANKDTSKNYSNFLKFQDNFDYCVEKLKKMVDLYFSEVIFYTGEAGIGKSHTLAHFIDYNYYKNDIPCILLLGVDFGNDTNVSNQICDITGSDNIDNFLYYTNELGVLHDVIVPIIIDGINESNNKLIWNNGLYHLVNEASKYSNIKLLFSIRSTYFDVCVPNDIIKNNVIKVIHNGFNTNIKEAVTSFFEAFQITVPIFQIINNEFHNPLFLNIFCHLVKDYSISLDSNDYHNFIVIFNEYISTLNRILLKKYAITLDFNIIDEVINCYIKFYLSTNNYPVISEFLVNLKIISELYDINKRELLDYVIDNGLFYVEHRNNKDILLFSFERYLNISLAKYLLKNISNIDELKESINHGYLHRYFDFIEVLDNGLLDELVCIILIEFKVDLLSIIDFSHFHNDMGIIKSYIKSMVWYTGECDSTSIIKHLKKYMNDNLYQDLFIETYVRMSYIKNNPLNSLFLHDSLKNFSLNELDYYWTIQINNHFDYNDGSIINIIRYCIDNGSSSLDGDSAYLVGIILSYFLSSTCRKLRDLSTRALTKLLLNNHKLSIKLLNMFKDTVDYYILERLIASIYGSIIRSNKNDFLEELCSDLYNVIYKGDKVVNHVLIKLYCLKIFHYVKDYFGYDFYDHIIDEKKSSWYDKLPTNEDIDKYNYSLEEMKKERSKFSIDLIIHSMTTEYGRGISCYGDFGRYVLQGYLEPFKYHFDDIQLLANKATELVFEMGYDYKKFGNYDNSVSYYNSRMNTYVERIGKKYQWIATYELLSRLYDNYIPFYCLNSDDKIDYSIRNYFDEDFNITTDNENVRYTTYTLEEENNHLIMIDTTNFLLSHSLNKEFHDFDSFYYNDEINYKDYLFSEINGIKYVRLFYLITIEDRSYLLKRITRNSLTVSSTAFFYLNDDLLSKSSIKSYSQGSYNEIYNVPLFDFPYSPESILYNSRRYYDQDLDSSYITGYEYHVWENYNDKSIDSSIMIYTPNIWVIDQLNLVQKEEGKWYQNDELVCFQPDIEHANSELVLRYDKLLEILKKNKCLLGWTMFIEKSSNESFSEWRTIVKYNYMNDCIDVDVYQSDNGTVDRFY